MTRWPGLLLLALLLSAAEPAAPNLTPAFQRLDLAPDASAEVRFAVHGVPGTVIAAVLVDCACLHVLTPLPLPLDADGNASIVLRATGLRPGVEDIQLATSTGPARAQLQIAGPGAGRGIDALDAIAAAARRDGGSLLGVAHDLRGQVRHCACSAGSLGAADRLAALPAFLRGRQPGLRFDWVLSGDVDGQRPGVGEALAAAGWSLRDPRVAVAADPGPLLAAPGVVAVIPNAASAIQHRRILRPVLDGGLAVELLLIDAQGRITEHRTMPVDDSLPSDPALPQRFPDRLTATIVEAAQPGAACIACHLDAHRRWLASPHAAAWTKLPVADRTDACVGCHTTPLGGNRLAPAVQCQACHPGSDAHAAQPTVKPPTAADCRQCHDAQHDPGFRRETAWERIAHPRTAGQP